MNKEQKRDNKTSRKSNKVSKAIIIININNSFNSNCDEK